MKNIPAHLLRILSLARWAPSGDNTQPWRFEILGHEHILIHGYDTRDHVVYDLDGHSSQLAVGALLETIRIAATTESRLTYITRRPKTPENHLHFDVHFQPTTDVTPDQLAPSIKTRVVQRRAMSTRPLTETQKKDLANALPPGYRVVWFEGLPQRWRAAKLMFDNAKVRLTIPEAYEVHKAVIRWGARYSFIRIPDQAIGVDPLTAKIMRWTMANWQRIEFVNTRLMGHLPPRIQLDLLPGLFCAAHFALLSPTPLHSVDDYIAAGSAMQRFWLTATNMGLFIQPEMTPVIFTRYHRNKRHYTHTAKAKILVERLNERLIDLLPNQEIETLYFMGRLGHGTAPVSRSKRLPMSRLILSTQSDR